MRAGRVAADAVLLAGVRQRGAPGADAAHGSGQRPRLRRPAAGPAEAAARYFARLAERRSPGSIAIGFPPCPGGAMASNPRWCQPLAAGTDYFREWMARPAPEHVLAASMYFDLRPVVGDSALGESLGRSVRSEAPGHRRFLRRWRATSWIGGCRSGCSGAPESTRRRPIAAPRSQGRRGHPAGRRRPGPRAGARSGETGTAARFRAAGERGLYTAGGGHRDHRRLRGSPAAATGPPARLSARRRGRPTTTSAGRPLAPRRPCCSARRCGRSGACRAGSVSGSRRTTRCEGRHRRRRGSPPGVRRRWPAPGPRRRSRRCSIRASWRSTWRRPGSIHAATTSLRRRDPVRRGPVRSRAT